jgi:hypothetical protein
MEVTTPQNETRVAHVLLSLVVAKRDSAYCPESLFLSHPTTMALVVIRLMLPLRKSWGRRFAQLIFPGLSYLAADTPDGDWSHDPDVDSLHIRGFGPRLESPSFSHDDTSRRLGLLSTKSVANNPTEQ